MKALLLLLFLLLLLLSSCTLTEIAAPIPIVNNALFKVSSDERWVYIEYRSTFSGIEMILAPTLEEVQNPTELTNVKYWEWTCIYRMIELPYRPVYVRIIAAEFDSIQITN